MSIFIELLIPITFLKLYCTPSPWRLCNLLIFITINKLASGSLAAHTVCKEHRRTSKRLYVRGNMEMKRMVVVTKSRDHYPKALNRCSGRASSPV